MEQIKTKREIYAQIERYHADPNKPLSWKFLAELSGISYSLLKRVFVVKDLDMSVETQIRISRCLDRLARGEVVVMRNKDKTRVLVYRKENRPRVARSVELDLKGGKLCLKVGLKNKSDYSQPLLIEKLERK